MSGSGIGSALGTGLGILLAPETGGASMLLPAVLGAAGGAAGAGLTGGNVLQSGIMGGLGGALGGATMGGQDIAGLGSLGNAATAEQANLPAEMAAETGASAADTASGLTGSTISSMGVSSPAAINASSSIDPSLQGVLNNTTGNAAGGSGGFLSNAASKLGDFVSKNPLQALGTGAGLLGALSPQKGFTANTNWIQQTNQQLHPGQYQNLPNFQLNTVNTPINGDWYTYGQRPQQAMQSTTLQKYAKGGRVAHMAMGGVPPMPAVASPLNPTMPQQMPNQASMQANPLYHVGRKIGEAMAQHIKNHGMTPDGQVKGRGKGQDDAIPAKLSQDEYVIPADVVAHLGDGSSNAGGKELDKMVHKVRSHKAKAHAKFPPKAKSPLSYIGRK